MKYECMGKRIRQQPHALFETLHQEKVELGSMDRYQNKPEWRWIVARRVNNEPELGKWYEQDRYSDAFVFMRVVPFMRAWQESKTNEKQLAALERSHPEYVWAADIFERTSAVRWYLEACVMTGAPVEDIAKALEIPTTVVRVYEMMFFDVRSRLDNDVWINLNILLPRKTPGHEQPDYLWKAVGYAARGTISSVNELTTWYTTKLSREKLRRAHEIIYSNATMTALHLSCTAEPTKYDLQAVSDNYLKLLEHHEDGQQIQSESAEQLKKVVTELSGEIKPVTMDDPHPAQPPVFADRNMGERARELAEKRLT